MKNGLNNFLILRVAVFICGLFLSSYSYASFYINTGSTAYYYKYSGISCSSLAGGNYISVADATAVSFYTDKNCSKNLLSVSPSLFVSVDSNADKWISVVRLSTSWSVEDYIAGVIRFLQFDITDLSSSAYTISYSASPNQGYSISRYDIYYRFYNGSQWSNWTLYTSTLYQSVPFSHYYSDGNWYKFKVMAVDTSGSSVWSDIKNGYNQIVSDVVIPPSVSNLTYFISGTVNLSWLSSQGEYPIVSYEIERKKIDGSYSVVGISNTDSYADAVSMDEPYYYRVRAKDSNGNYSDYSNEILVKFVLQPKRIIYLDSKPTVNEDCWIQVPYNENNDGFYDVSSIEVFKNDQLLYSLNHDGKSIYSDFLVYCNGLDVGNNYFKYRYKSSYGSYSSFSIPLVVNRRSYYSNFDRCHLYSVGSPSYLAYAVYYWYNPYSNKNEVAFCYEESVRNYYEGSLVGMYNGRAGYYGFSAIRRDVELYSLPDVYKFFITRTKDCVLYARSEPFDSGSPLNFAYCRYGARDIKNQGVGGVIRGYNRRSFGNRQGGIGGYEIQN